MQNFIVLGLVPGTQVQITFQLWLQLIGLLLAGFVGYRIIKNRRAISIRVLNFYIRLLVREPQLRLHF